MRKIQKSRLACAIILAAAATVNAADRFWVGGSGSFFLPTNWSATEGGAPGATPPGAADIANFTASSTYTVLSPITVNIQQVVVKGSNVTLDLAGTTLTTTNTAGVRIGTTTTDIGRLTVTDGTLAVSSAFNDIAIGSSQDTTGFLTVTTGGKITGLPDIDIGGQGTGTLSVQNGGSIDASRGFIGDGLSSTGTATVTGAGSSWTNSNDVFVGLDGFGTLNVSSGGFVSSGSTLYVAFSPSSVGTVNLTGSGSTLANAGVLVGNNGMGSIFVRSGAQMTSTSSILGGNSSAEGNITISDAGSLWNESGNSLIGQSGQGTVVVENGGRWINSGAVVTLGSGATSSGTVTIRGSKSIFSVLGNLSVASAGNGTLNVSAGAEVSVGGTLSINNPAGAPVGTLNFDGGSITVNSLTRAGNLNWTDGTLTVKGGVFNNSSLALTINGGDNDDLPTLQMISGAVGQNFSGSGLNIGSNRQGVLNINTNASLSANDIHLGSAGGSGTVSVSSGGTLTANGNIALGGSNISASGSGTLNLDPGGSLTATSILRLWPGGTLNLNGGTLNVVSLLPSGGRINFNSGEITFLGGATFNDPTLDTLLGQAHSLGAGQTIRTPSNFTLTSDITISGGALIATGIVQTFSNITMTGGSLSGGTEVDIGSNAVLAMQGGAITAPNINNIGGEFQLHVGALVLPSAAFNNAGVLTGSGQITGVLFNNPTGSVRADAGQRLVITGSGGTNNGALEAIGGEVEFTHGWTNNATGTISGRNAMLRFGTGLTNSGTLGLSFGVSDVFGTISNNSGGKIIVSGNSQATFWNSISNNSGAELRISSGSTAVFFGPVANSGTISGGGVKIFEGGGSGLGAVSTPGSTIVEAAASVNASFFRENALTVNGLVTINTTGGTSHLNALNISEDGVLDLKNNSLVLEGGDLAVITSQIKSGLYQGVGITSSAPGAPFRLGSMSNVGPVYTSFQGIGGLDGDEVLIRYTRMGDLNLDGTVTISDFIDLASNFNHFGAATWQMGDVNYDGSVTISDFIDLAANFNQSVSGEVLPSSASAVPEPASVALAIFAATGLFRRRRAAFTAVKLVAGS